MEENNRKGPGVFYAVVGVATLVVAIIGATFAYFSASVTPATGSDEIQGATQNVSGASLHLTVDKVDYHSTNSTDYDTLVPAFFGGSAGNLTISTPSQLTDTQVTNMVNAKCAYNGFTGCHVYKITFGADQNVAHANLLLGMELTGEPTNKEQWGYALFTSTGNVENGTAGTVTMLGGNAIPGSIGNGFTGDNRKDIHNNGALTVDTNGDSVDVVYYLLVYVNDTDLVQNDSETTAQYVVGGYTGNLELQALGGKVRATFSAASTPSSPEPENP